MASSTQATGGLLAGYDHQDKKSMRLLGFLLSEWKKGARSTRSAHIQVLTDEQIKTLEAICIQESIDEEWKLLVEEFLERRREGSNVLMQAALALATHATNVDVPPTPLVSQLLTAIPCPANASYGVGPRNENGSSSATKPTLRGHADLLKRLKSISNPRAEDLKALTEGLIDYEVNKDKGLDGTAQETLEQEGLNEFQKSMAKTPVFGVLREMPIPSLPPPKLPHILPADEIALSVLRRRLSASSSPEVGKGNGGATQGLPHDHGSTNREGTNLKGQSEVPRTEKHTPLRLIVNRKPEDRFANALSQEDQDRLFAMKLQAEDWNQTVNSTGYEAELYKSKPYRKSLQKPAETPFEQFRGVSQVSDGSVAYGSSLDDRLFEQTLTDQEREERDLEAAIAESLKMENGNLMQWESHPITGKRPSSTLDGMLPTAKRANYEGIVTKPYVSLYGSKQKNSNGNSVSIAAKDTNMDMESKRQSAEPEPNSSSPGHGASDKDIQDDEDAPFELDDEYNDTF